MADLATVADIEARLGRDLTTEEAARVGAMLADASALVRDYTGQEFDFVEDDSIVLRPIRTEILLPQRPVTEVSSVTALSGLPNVADLTLPVGTWEFDGVDMLNIWPIDRNIWLSLPELWLDGTISVDTYRVVYSHGYQTVPAVVVAVVCGMVMRALLSPSLSPGMVSERIGQYFYQTQQASGASGAVVGLTEDDEKRLSRYRRRKSSTIPMRIGGL